MAKVLNTRLTIMLAAIVVFTGGLIMTASAGNHKHGSGKADASCKSKTCSEDDRCTKCNQAMKHKHGKHAMMAARAGHSAKQAQHLQNVLSKLTAAEDALKEGNTKHAHKAIKEARKIVASVHKSVRPAVANKSCPIMGGKIEKEAVSANLYRMHKGKGVGFCCAGCPAAWDKLSDASKTEKLTEAGVKLPSASKRDVQFVAPDASDAAQAVGEAIERSRPSKGGQCGAK